MQSLRRLNIVMLETVLLVSGGALLLYMFGLWVLSLLLRDVSIADLGWGPGFVIVTWIAFAAGEGYHGRRLLLVVLVSVWGLRLSSYLLVRKLSEGREDPRYTAMLERYGSRFPLISLGVVFLFQGVLIWVVSLPVQGLAPQLDRLGVLDWAGAGVWAVGLFFEAVGDGQLRRFKADPVNQGRVMDRGLWRYTRHPNYFGDFLIWWGIYLIALSGGAWRTIVGPLVMSTLLINVSGKRLLETYMSKRPGYAGYMARTSGFFPLPARRSSR
jgi:steroid 5-alpha reductase family enzyme